MKRAIARHLKEQEKYEGVPRLVIEAVAEDVISFLGRRVDAKVTVDLLEEVDGCESCGDYFLPGQMERVSYGDEVYSLCEDCLDALKKDEAPTPIEKHKGGE